jgi:hypothetical protein
MAGNVILFALDFHHLSRRLRALERLGLYQATEILIHWERGNASGTTGKFGGPNQPRNAVIASHTRSLTA